MSCTCSGDVLIEMGTEDLDYLNITILAHRKMLLKSIRQLQQKEAEKAALESNSTGRRNHKKDCVQQTNESTTAKSVSESSQKPLDAVAAAEAAEHEAFKAAVMAWRNSKAPEAIASQTESSWENPFADSNDEKNTLSAKTGKFDSTFPTQTKDLNTETTPDHDTKEHSKFVAAVEQWRTGKSDNSNGDLGEKIGRSTVKRLGLNETDLSNKENSSWYKTYNLAFSNDPRKLTEHLSSLQETSKEKLVKPATSTTEGEMQKSVTEQASGAQTEFVRVKEGKHIHTENKVDEDTEQDYNENSGVIISLTEGLGLSEFHTRPIPRNDNEAGSNESRVSHEDSTPSSRENIWEADVLY